MPFIMDGFFPHRIHRISVRKHGISFGLRMEKLGAKSKAKRGPERAAVPKRWKGVHIGWLKKEVRCWWRDDCLTVLTLFAW